LDKLKIDPVASTQLHPRPPLLMETKIPTRNPLQERGFGWTPFKKKEIVASFNLLTASTQGQAGAHGDGQKGLQHFR